MSAAAGNDRGTNAVEAPLTNDRVDVHVLVVPTVAWRSDLRFAYSSVCLESASAGFVRVGIYITLVGLRSEIALQLSPSLLPGRYVFLRNLGRCFSWVSSKQEEDMTISMFIPPMTASPEVYVLDAACFRGFPGSIVDSSCVVSDSRHSFPLEQTQPSSGHLPSRQNQLISLSPHHPDRNLVFMQPQAAFPLNFMSSDRKATQQQLPNLLPRRQQHQPALRQRAYTLDGSDLVQHLSYYGNQQDQPDISDNVTSVPTGSDTYISLSKAGNTNESSNSNSLSEHSYGIDDLHQESGVLTTSYGPSWQSSATQSLVMADSAATSLCSTTLPSSLNGAHHYHSPAKSLTNSSSALHDSISSRSKAGGPRLNVDLNLADSVITENTEVLERALFGSRGDGEGASLTNSMLNITGATVSHRNPQQNLSWQGDRSQLLSQLHPQVVQHYHTSSGNSNLQGDHLPNHGSDGTLPSNNTVNDNTNLDQTTTSSPEAHNTGVSNLHTTSGEVTTTNGSIVHGEDSKAVMMRSQAIKPHSDQRSSNTSPSKIMLASKGIANQVRITGGQLPVAKATTSDGSPVSIQAKDISTASPSNITCDDHMLLPADTEDSSLAPKDECSDGLHGDLVIAKPVEDSAHSNSVGGQSDSSSLLPVMQSWKESMSSSVMAVRSSIDGDSCSQSRADNTVANNVTTSSPSNTCHVTVNDGEHQFENSCSPAASVNRDGKAVRTTNTTGSSSDNKPQATQQHQSSTPVGTNMNKTVSNQVTTGSVKVAKQQSPLSERGAGVGTSMLFSTSPLPPITSSADSASEATRRPVELDEVNQLLAQLRMVRDDRKTLENVKKGLSDSVKKLQRANRGAQEREDKRWKRMYFQEKRLTQTNEDRLRRLRNEMHRRVGAMTIRNQQDTPLKDAHRMLSPVAINEGPSEAVNVKIQCARVERDLGRLRQRLLVAQERLKVEKEARVMAESDNKTIRKNVLQQKINCTLTRTI